MIGRAKAWVIDAAHVPNGWWLIAPFAILGVGMVGLVIVDDLDHTGHPLLAWSVPAVMLLALIAGIVVGLRHTDAP